MPFQIFISYRREGGAELAHLLYTRLSMDGYEVFFDVESMRAGKFNRQLYERIEECGDILVILPPHALDFRDTEEDWVRMEIAHALKEKKNVIPVLMRNFEWPEELPENISELKYCQGVSASMEYFEAVYERIKQLLQIQPGKGLSDKDSIFTMGEQLHHGEVLLANDCFQEAGELYDRILMQKVGCGDAYLGRLMASRRIGDREQFREYFSRNLLNREIDLKMAQEYADPALMEYLGSLQAPECREHAAEAIHECSQCGEFLCDLCAHAVPCEEWGEDEDPPWPVGKVLCPSCVDLLRGHIRRMIGRCRIKIIFHMSLVILLIVMSFLLCEGDVGFFFIGMGFGGLVIYFVHQFFSAHTCENCEETIDLMGWLILLLLKILLFSLITPIVLLWSLVRSVIWLIRIAQLQKLEDCRTDFVYCELVKITRAVHSSEPNGWDPQIQ